MSNKTLTLRGSKYGHYHVNSRTVQALKSVVRTSANWGSVSDSMRESIDSILVKISRILSGDPYHADSWHDISGYAKLIEAQLTGKNAECLA